MKLAYTRAIVDAIHGGRLKEVPTVRDSVFGFEVPTECEGVPSEILIPRNTWHDPARYDEARIRLARLFQENFETYSDGASEEILEAGPKAA
jgi:phosphoenolpyruvate carboxykinase (ATP)